MSFYDDTSVYEPPPLPEPPEIPDPVMPEPAEAPEEGMDALSSGTLNDVPEPEPMSDTNPAQDAQGTDQPLEEGPSDQPLQEQQGQSEFGASSDPSSQTDGINELIAGDEYAAAGTQLDDSLSTTASQDALADQQLQDQHLHDEHVQEQQLQGQQVQNSLLAQKQDQLASDRQLESDQLKQQDRQYDASRDEQIAAGQREDEQAQDKQVSDKQHSDRQQAQNAQTQQAANQQFKKRLANQQLANEQIADREEAQGEGLHDAVGQPAWPGGSTGGAFAPDQGSMESFMAADQPVGTESPSLDDDSRVSTEDSDPLGTIPEPAATGAASGGEAPLGEEPGRAQGMGGVLPPTTQNVESSYTSEEGSIEPLKTPMGVAADPGDPREAQGPESQGQEEEPWSPQWETAERSASTQGDGQLPQLEEISRRNQAELSTLLTPEEKVRFDEAFGPSGESGESPEERPARPESNEASRAARDEFARLRQAYAEELGVGPRGQVHHAIELQVLDRYPGAFTPKELNSLENMRGIPRELTGDELERSLKAQGGSAPVDPATYLEENPDRTKMQLHNSKIREIMDRKYVELDRGIAANGLEPGTAEYRDYVRGHLTDARDEIDHTLGQLFSEYRAYVRNETPAPFWGASPETDDEA